MPCQTCSSGHTPCRLFKIQGADIRNSTGHAQQRQQMACLGTAGASYAASSVLIVARGRQAPDAGGFAHFRIPRRCAIIGLTMPLLTWIESREDNDVGYR